MCPVSLKIAHIEAHVGDQILIQRTYFMGEVLAYILPGYNAYFQWGQVVKNDPYTYLSYTVSEKNGRVFEKLILLL